jgi:hypothetical protein
LAKVVWDEPKLDDKGPEFASMTIKVLLALIAARPYGLGRETAKNFGSLGGLATGSRHASRLPNHFLTARK